MTAAAAYWPQTGRLETWGAFADTPDLEARGEADGLGRRYVRMYERGELRTWPGLVTPVGPFLADVARDLAGEWVVGAAADAYRRAEAVQALRESGAAWPMAWRRLGRGPDGFADIRAFQIAVLQGRLRTVESLLLASGSRNPASSGTITGTRT